MGENVRRIAQFFLCIFVAGAWSTRAHSQITIITNEGPVVAYTKSIALLIGNSAYRTISWGRLPSIPNEIEALKEALKRGGFDVRVKLNLPSSELSPTIKQFLQEQYGPSTRLLVFYAGHGWTDRNYTGYIVPVDAPAPTDSQFRAKLTSMAEIKTWADDSDANHIIFLFDSCFSGSVFLSRQNLKPPALFMKSALRRTRQYITAGNEEETVPAVSEFVPAIIRGLKGEADLVPDGVITGNELGYWLSSTLARNGNQTPQFGSVVSGTSSPGDVVFTYGEQPGPKVALARATEPAAKSAKETITRSIGEPDGPDAALFRGLDISYFQKAADGRAIIKVLDSHKFHFEPPERSCPKHSRPMQSPAVPTFLMLPYRSSRTPC